MSSTVFSPCSVCCSRSLTSTAAPARASASAQARPIPPAAPVTSPLFPVSGLSAMVGELDELDEIALWVRQVGKPNAGAWRGPGWRDCRGADVEQFLVCGLKVVDAQAHVSVATSQDGVVMVRSAQPTG